MDTGDLCVYEVCAEVNVINSDTMYGYFTLVIVGLLKDFFSLDGYQSNSTSSGLMSTRLLDRRHALG